MKRRAIVLSALLALGATAVSAQTRNAKRIESPETWGSSTGHSTIMNYRLQPTNATGSPNVYTLYHQGSAGTSCHGDAEAECLGYAQIDVPDGASLETLRVWYYDSSVDADLHYVVVANCEPPGGPAVSIILSQGDPPASAGDSYYEGDLGGATVDNADCGYSVRLRLTDPGKPPQNFAIRVRKLAVTWNRQVSPAPGDASFGDVPTDHPFFQFVEALAKSGITGGCGGGNYCPNAPLTRGQMAVFLAKALGLQWP